MRLPACACRVLLRHAERVISSREPDEVLGSHRGAHERWCVSRATLRHRWELYVHRFVADDDSELHDHPWPSLSLLLSGVLREIMLTGERTISAGTLVYRPAAFAHRLEIVSGTPVSLCAVGSWIRAHGYWTENGWIAAV